MEEGRSGERNSYSSVNMCLIQTMNSSGIPRTWFLTWGAGCGAEVPTGRVNTRLPARRLTEDGALVIAGALFAAEVAAEKALLARMSDVDGTLDDGWRVVSSLGLGIGSLRGGVEDPALVALCLA